LVDANGAMSRKLHMVIVASDTANRLMAVYLQGIVQQLGLLGFFSPAAPATPTGRRAGTR
jgi:hypothetical protein